MSRGGWRGINPFVVAAISRAGVQAVTLLAMLLAVSSLDAATFGAFSIAWVTAVVANGVMYSGLYEHLLRVRDVDDAKHSVFWLLAAQSTAWMLIMLTVGLLASGPQKDALRFSFFVLAAVPLLAAPMAWCDALLVRKGRVATVGLVLLIAEGAGFATLVLGLRMGWRLEALVAWRVVATVTAFLALALFSAERPRPRLQRAAVRDALATAWPLQGSAVVRMLSTYAGDFLLAWYLSPAAAGAYRAASRVTVAATDVFSQPLRPISWAVIARNEREEDPAAMRQTLLAHLRMLSFITWPLLFFLMVFSERIQRAFTGPDWTGLASLIVLMALARMPAAFDFFLEPVLACTGRSKLIFKVRTGFTSVLLLGIVLSAPYGPAAVAGWQALLALLSAVTAMLLIRRALSLPVWQLLKTTWPAVLMAVISAGAGEVVFHSLWLSERSRLIASGMTLVACLLAGFAVFSWRKMIHLPRT